MEENKFKKIKKVLWIIMILNFAVATAKVIMGTIISSGSMTADGFHSFTDGSSNIIGLIGIGIAAKPMDSDHPYGHRKYETLAGLFIIAMLIFLGLKIISDAFAKFMNPVIPDISIESLVVMIITLCINIFVAKYEYKKGIALNSTILVSDSTHTRSDIYVTIGVIITLIAIKLGTPPIVDSIASLVVAGFIFHAAYEIFIVASGILVDGIATDAKKIESIARCQEGVLGIHGIRSRGAIDDIHIDMHIEANPSLTLEESHRLTHDIENALKSEINSNVEVIIHIEPYKDESSKRECKKLFANG